MNYVAGKSNFVDFHIYTHISHVISLIINKYSFCVWLFSLPTHLFVNIICRASDELELITSQTPATKYSFQTLPTVTKPSGSVLKCAVCQILSNKVLQTFQRDKGITLVDI